MIVTPEDFVRAWTRAKDIAGVCKATGLTHQQSVKRSWHYRNAGVNLKRLLSDAASRRGRKPTINVDALNAIIAGMGKKSRKIG